MLPVNFKSEAFLFALCLLFIFSCKEDTEASSPMLFAASSLEPLLSHSFANSNTQFNFASSGTLARQISNAKIPALFISADTSWINFLDRSGIKPLKSKEILLNRLVFAAHPNYQNKIPNRWGFGDSNFVPLGKHSFNALKNLGRDSLYNNAVLAQSARQNTQWLELGEIDRSIIYLSDACQNSKIRVLDTIASSAHAPISYTLVQYQHSAAADSLFAKFNTPEFKNHALKFCFQTQAKNP